mmetsp:Transcript_21977/g.61139  ORF Transcript_21977/g.61139 Transcript_21977/m.61139 type:complete len:228 (-) Transcript_21977:599-1282(-)
MFGFTVCSAVYIKPVATEIRVKTDSTTRASCNCQSSTTYVFALFLPMARSMNRSNVSRSWRNRCRRRTRNSCRLNKPEGWDNADGKICQKEAGVTVTASGNITTRMSATNCGSRTNPSSSRLDENHRATKSTKKIAPTMISPMRMKGRKELRESSVESATRRELSRTTSAIKISTDGSVRKLAVLSLNWPKGPAGSMSPSSVYWRKVDCESSRLMNGVERSSQSTQQ